MNKQQTYNTQAAQALGAQLRQAREQQGLAPEAVAAKLKLSVEQIQALEAGDYAPFSGLVFAGGFLRTYARLLHLSETEIEGRLNTIMPKAADHVYAVKREQNSGLRYESSEKAGFPKWMLSVAALALLGAVVYAWQSKSNSANEQQQAEESSAVQNSLQAPALQASNVSVSKMTDEGKETVAAEASASAASAVAASAAAAPVQVAADELWIKVQYRSNLIIKDKDGKMVFSRIIPAGSERRFQGGAPYDVWIGIAAGAEANYGGTAIKPESYRAAGEKAASFVAGKK